MSKHGKHELGVSNAYERIPKQFLKPAVTFPNAEVIQCGVGRYMVVGQPGSMKSNLVVCHIEDCIGLGNVSNLLVFAGTLDVDPLYQALRLEATKRKMHGVFSQTLDDLCTCDFSDAQRKKVKDADEDGDTPCPKIHLSDIDPADGISVLVLDDMLTADKKQLAKLRSWWMAGRRHNVSAFFVTQNCTSVPVELRRMSDYYCIKANGMNIDDLTRLLSSLTSKDNVPKVLDLWRRICALGDKTQFLFINAANPDPTLRFRHNYRRTVIAGLK